MPIRPLSFQPPRIGIDADLDWVLCAAFGNVATCEQPRDPRRALQIAQTTQLSGRIAARLRSFREGSAADALAEELNAYYYENVVKQTLLMHALRRLGQLAERFGTRVIAVKFGGLRLAGLISVGSREASDLDVLLPKGRARAFWRALVAAGFQRTNTHEYPHQLEALVDPDGAIIDLHVHLPGVVIEKGTFATAEQLAVHGLLTKADSSTLVPRIDVLAAHAIAHALVQNRSTPQTHSPMRLLADLMDLRRAEPQIVRNAARYLAPELEPTCATLERLCTSLSEGDFRGPNFHGTSEQILLWHCLAARLDTGYAERLRAAGLAHKFRDGSSALEVGRYIADLLYPSESALDALYGPATGTISRVRRRLGRPLDLIVRTIRRSMRSRGG
ncbi:MAG TPA: nucleotidyltransferase family protein [Polyangiaceae bacterium]|nr:nucleotidyltransferase family protein [Polyangiaceae bacterium]